MNLQETFAAEVESFLALAQMEPSRFGREVMGDPTFVFELRNGRVVGLATADKVRAFIRAYRRPEAAA